MLKKIIIIISIFILGLSVIGTNINYLNNNDIPVNLEVKKHVEIEYQIPEDITTWAELKDFFGLPYLKPVENLDPEQRDNRFLGFFSGIQISSNANLVLKSSFVVNQENMDQEFYNNLENNLDGAIGVLSLANAIQDPKTGDFYTYPMRLAEQREDGDYTLIRKSHDYSKMYLLYNFSVKFTDENWWKVQAGKNINIGTIHVTVEAVDDF